MKNFMKKAGVLAAIAAAPLVFAGTGGTEFDSIYTTLSDWATGTLGKVIALGMILTGLGIGVVKQSIMAVVVGISCGLALFNAPVVIDQVVGAVL